MQDILKAQSNIKLQTRLITTLAQRLLLYGATSLELPSLDGGGTGAGQRAVIRVSGVRTLT